MNRLFERTPPVPTLDAPWTRRELWGGFTLAMLFYVLASVAGSAILSTFELQNSPLLGPILVPTQVAMLLPPLLVMLRYGRLPARLGLDRFDARMLGEMVVALGLAYCGICAWGLVLLPFGLQAQEPLVPLFGEGLAALVSVYVVAGLIAPVVEEIVFRGFLFGGLRTRMPVGWAAVVSGLLFALAHLQPLAFPALFLLGVVLALLYHRTGSLWSAIWMHFAINSFAVIGQFIVTSQGLA